jgi:hypothetical protein
MFVKPSNTNPSALRKAAWEKAQAERNAQAKAAVVASVKKG